MLEFLITNGPAQGSALAFPGGRFTIGSDAACQLRLDGPNVLPKHVEVAVALDGSVWVRDLSGGQTRLDGRPLAQKANLRVGSFLSIGGLELALRAHDGGPSGTMTVPTPLRSPPVRPRTGAAPSVGTSGRSAALPGYDDAAALGSTAKRPSAGRQPSASGPVDLGHTAKRPSAGRQAQAGIEPPQPGEDFELPSAEDRTRMTAGIRPDMVINDRYRIIGLLAAGGMGEVYKAEHVELGRLFALKVMKPELSSDAEFVERFKREAIASSRIGQQNIIDITDFGRTEYGAFFFVMEFLEGDTLASVIHRQGPQPVLRALHIFAQSCRALAAAHNLGIVHRDLKPENIMLLQRAGQPDLVKVLDFGVAKVSTGQGKGGQTAIGMVVGTPQYMSPEQAMGILVDARSDIYSMGLILYELLTGRTVFEGATPSILMMKQMSEAPPGLSPGPIGPIPQELEGLIYAMLAKKPEDRPPTMDAVLGVIEAQLSQVRRTGSVPALAPASGASFARQPPSVATPTTQAAPRPSGSQVVMTQEQFEALQSGQLRAIRPSRAPLYAVLAVLGVAGLVGGGYFATRKPEVVAPPPPVIIEKVVEKPTPPPGTPMVTLTLDSVPQGAEVFEGEVALGNTPLVLTREKSTSILDVTFRHKGFKDEARKVPMTADRSLTVDLDKEKAARRVGPRPPKPDEDDLKDPYAQDDDLKALPE